MWKLAVRVGAWTTALVVLIAVGGADAATLKGEYRLQGTLRSEVAGAPDLVDVGAGNRFQPETVGGSPRQVLVFSRGGGVSVRAAGLIDAASHSIVMVFRLAHVAGFRRLMDFSGGAGDDGLYAMNGMVGIQVGDLLDVGFPRGAPPPRFAPGAYVEVALTSEETLAGTQWTEAYVNGSPVAATSTPDGFVITGKSVRLFRDNIAGPARGEESGGALACVLVYDGALTADEVRQDATDPTRCPVVDSTPATPLSYEPGDYAGTTSQGLPISFTVERGRVERVMFAWRARCADGKIHTNTIVLAGGPISRGRFSIRDVLDTGAHAQVFGHVEGSAASGTLSRWGNSAFNTSCPDRGVRWRARRSGSG